MSGGLRRKRWLMREHAFQFCALLYHAKHVLMFPNVCPPEESAANAANIAPPETGMPVCAIKPWKRVHPVGSIMHTLCQLLENSCRAGMHALSSQDRFLSSKSRLRSAVLSAMQAHLLSSCVEAICSVRLACAMIEAQRQ